MENTPRLPKDLELFLAAHTTLANRDPVLTRDLLRVATEILPEAQQIKIARMLYNSTSPSGRTVLENVMRGDA